MTVLANEFPGLTDDEIVDSLALAFDRPAFKTPFHEESSLPAFLRAIEDTIGALNTGLGRTRDGHEIRRIASLHHVRDATRRDHLSNASQALDDLRRLFKRRLDEGSIRHCQCGDKDCPTFTMDAKVGQELDSARDAALVQFSLAGGRRP
jgi:hypothetical protein